MNRAHSENLPKTPSARRPVQCKGGLFRANLKAYLDGETSALRGWLVRGHLAQCAECREELLWLRRLGEDMKELESTRPRPELRARILASLPTTPPAPGIRVVYSRPDRERFPQWMPRLALAGGLAMLLAFSGVFALKRSAGVTVASQEGAVGSARWNSQQRKTVQDTADTQVSGPSDLDMVTYTPPDDPNNALADKMFHDQMVGIEREKLLLGQDDWHRLLAQARAVARKTDQTTPTEMGVALAVSNIADVRTHLPTWAKQEGATLVATGKPSPETANNMALPSLRTEDPAANLVAFAVPAEHGPAFLGALKQLGQISILPLASNLPVSSSLKSGPHVQSEPASDGLRKAIPVAPVNADLGASPDKVVVAHDKHRYLLLTVLLTTAHN